MSKYRATRTEYNGVGYPSKAEAKRAEWLDMMMRAGEVRYWIPQPKFYLGLPENAYKSDFLVMGRDGLIRVEEVKGHWTKKFKRDVKLWKRYGPEPLWVLKYDYRKNSWGCQVISPEGKR